MQLTVKKLKHQIENMPDDMPVFFRRVAPICGNIEEANAAIMSEYSSFGVVSPCLIIEPFVDTPDDEEQEDEQGEQVYCQACSESGGADRPIYHGAPACKI